MLLDEKPIFIRRNDPSADGELPEGDVFVPIPGNIEKSRRFVDMARALAEKRGLDIDIWQSAYFLRADLHTFCVEDFGHDTGVLAELMTLSDRFSVHQGDAHQRITLRFVLFTHEFYHNGCLMNEW